MATYQEVEQWIPILHRKKRHRQTCWPCLEPFLRPKGDKQEGNCGTRLESLELQCSLESGNSMSRNAQGSAIPSATSNLTSTILPSDLNLTQGLAGTLMDDIVMYRRTEDERNGVNLLEQQRKRKERADAAAATHKKNMTGGQAAMMQKFRLGQEFLEHAVVRKRMAAEAQNEKEVKKQKEYEALRDKVIAIRLTNKTPTELTGTQLRVMVSWYKDDMDAGALKSKVELLTRLLETYKHADRQPPFPHLATVPIDKPPPPPEGTPLPEGPPATEEPPLPEGLNVLKDHHRPKDHRHHYHL